MSAATTTPALDEERAPLLPRVDEAARLIAVFGSPYRLLIVAAISDAGRLSPVEIHRLIGKPPSLGTVAYHVRTMAKFGVLEPAGERRRRGAIEHYYRLTLIGRAAADLISTFAS